MARLLIVVLVVVAVGWLLFGRRRNKSVEPAPGDASKSVGAGEEMVECAHCGVHLPRSDALVDGSALYCGPAHRAAGPRAR